MALPLLEHTSVPALAQPPTPPPPWFPLVTSVPFTIQNSYSSTSTADWSFQGTTCSGNVDLLTEWENDSSTVLASLDCEGDFIANGTIFSGSQLSVNSGGANITGATTITGELTVVPSPSTSPAFYAANPVPSPNLPLRSLVELRDYGIGLGDDCSGTFLICGSVGKYSYAIPGVTCPSGGCDTGSLGGINIKNYDYCGSSCGQSSYACGNYGAGACAYFSWQNAGINPTGTLIDLENNQYNCASSCPSNHAIRIGNPQTQGSGDVANIVPISVTDYAQADDMMDAHVDGTSGNVFAVVQCDNIATPPPTPPPQCGQSGSQGIAAFTGTAYFANLGASGGTCVPLPSTSAGYYFTFENNGTVESQDDCGGNIYSQSYNGVGLNPGYGFSQVSQTVWNLGSATNGANLTL